jgi:predicted component of viral defense system (DUF524 family)
MPIISNIGLIEEQFLAKLESQIDSEVIWEIFMERVREDKKLSFLFCLSYARESKEEFDSANEYLNYLQDSLGININKDLDTATLMTLIDIFGS